MHLTEEDGQRAEKADIISTVEFNHTGELLATGDKGGRVVVFQREQEEESFFLGTVNAGTDSWLVQLQVRQKNFCFKIDAGADVTALPADVYYEITGGDDVKHLAKPRRPLFGPGGNVLSVLGVTKETLRRGKKTATEDVYVVEDLVTALLGLPA
ncbi:hypothetical protein GJAV_G00134710 [Gymnothorax javanicus]|nr:hypothetical protein GJAV_G00134710 [Gymnothorax javanicus]